MESIVLGLGFIITLLMGMPIAFILGVVPTLYMIMTGTMPLSMIGQTLLNGMDSYVLLSIPFFILAGSLMNHSGITKDLVNFAKILVGKLPGGLAHVNILVSVFFAGLTGAAVADTSAVGSILIPSMKKDGYSAPYAAAVTTTSSIIGPIIPPSIIMVIYSSVTNESVGRLFMAGFIPGILVALGLMIMAFLFAIKYHHPRRTENMTINEVFTTVRRSLIALLVPVIIIGGILTGQFTPTEAAAIACAYVFLTGIFIYKRLNLENILASLKEAGLVSASILLIIATAKLFSVVLAMERIPESVAAGMLSIIHNKYIFLLVMNLFLLFMGMVMETGANVILLAPILLPMAVKYGVDPLHFALVMIVNLNIGLTTPPLGVCLFTVAPIAKTSLESIIPKVIPFVLMEVAVLMLITYFPELILFLPRLLGM